MCMLKKKNNGEYFEKIVELIEKAISPESIIERDVQMPILNSTQGSSTQCDIVIRTGNFPRETITLIEVQDRNSKIKPNDFRGWKQKLLDVGAQHLICVSRQNFPESIKEQAALTGNSIRLITLNNSLDEIPINLFTKSVFKILHFNIKEIEKMKIHFSQSQMYSLGLIDSINNLNSYIKNINSKIFSYNQKDLISLYDIINNLVKDKESENYGSVSFDVDFDITPFYLKYKEFYLKCWIESTVVWESKIENFPFTFLNYNQIGYGPIAWYMEANYNSDNKSAWVKIPIIKKENRFQISQIEHSNFENQTIKLEVKSESEPDIVFFLNISK
jgi:hypothetical protein